MPIQPNQVVGGSSPRGRGKRIRSVLHRDFDRLIPARAGKTSPRRSCAAGRGAHPRAGGENATLLALSTWADGSSPRGRGKPTNIEPTTVEYGLIPARAGKTHDWRVLHGGRAAHPRAGGENLMPVLSQLGETGSSPRGRGKHQVRWRHQEHSRLIPARAGKTIDDGLHKVHRRAHPRAGGENARVGRGAGSLAGSSPRGRGKPHRRDHQPRRRGLIPARAGKTRGHVWRR